MTVGQRLSAPRKEVHQMPRTALVCIPIAVACLSAGIQARSQPSSAPPVSREPASSQSQRRPDAGPFHLLSAKEATVADIRAALGAGALTCRQLVQAYIDRIEAYDRRGPALNSIVMLNSGALASA